MSGVYLDMSGVYLDMSGAYLNIPGVYLDMSGLTHVGCLLHNRMQVWGLIFIGMRPDRY